MHISRTKGDFIFAEWDDQEWKGFKKQVHELRKQGYRRIGDDHGWLDYYEYYRKRGSKKVVTVTMMCC